jgi:hypothetical protein
MEKICSKCKETKDTSEFWKCSRAKDGFRNNCKLCSKHYYLNNKEKYNSICKQYYLDNKEKISNCRKQYFLDNKEKISNRCKQYYLDNKEKISNRHKQYNSDNKEKIRIKKKQYNINNREKISKYEKDYDNYSTLYNIHFVDKLTVDELPRLNDDGINLEVKCKYCSKYFIPTNRSVRDRIKALSGIIPGDRSLYCSTGCKDSCPIYGQIKYPKGFKKVTAREVDPILRQMCFERDNWECQICGLSTEEVTLHCHHIEGYTQNPLLGNDIDNVITLCKSHHKEVHKLPGCNYHELKCNREE